jgi:hypothetical protein
MRNVTLVFAGLALSGCAGVSVNPITLTSAQNAHSNPTNVSGYIVYHPMVAVEISEKEVCVAKGPDGKCANSELRCAVGQPFLLPDYSKPYAIDIKSGLGKAGAEVEIVDGWRLGKVKDQSDNSGILGFIQQFAEKKLFAADPGKQTRRACQRAGIYRVNIEGSAVKLEPLTLY